MIVVAITIHGGCGACVVTCLGGLVFVVVTCMGVCMNKFFAFYVLGALY